MFNVSYAGHYLDIYLYIYIYKYVYCILIKETNIIGIYF